MTLAAIVAVVEAEFADYTVAQTVRGGSRSLKQLGESLVEVALSNDQGTTWETATDTNTYEVDFASGDVQLRWRATLGRYDDPDASTSPEPLPPSVRLTVTPPAASAPRPVRISCRLILSICHYTCKNIRGDSSISNTYRCCGWS